MKTSAQHSDGSGLVFRGPFVYGRSASGTLTFGSAAIAGGRITSAGVQYHVTDHLGSVVAVVKGSDGSVVESGKYADFGSRTDIVSAGTATAATNRWHFSGKEDQDVDFDLPYTDFGARLYSPGLGRWIAPDPASEKYYDLSPYAYCANNPVNLVDPDGRKLIFVNGLAIKNSLLNSFLLPPPGEPYWGSNSLFVAKAKEIFNDYNVAFPEIHYEGLDILPDYRRKAGYIYAKEHYDELFGDLRKGEPVRFVTHSMGAAFAEGMADYLLEQNVKVDALIHFEPYQAIFLSSNGKRQDVLTITFNDLADPVIAFLDNFGKGPMWNADHNLVTISTHNLLNTHVNGIQDDWGWKKIEQIIYDFLYGQTVN